MKHINRMFENTESPIIDEVKKIVDENQYITDKDVTADKLVVSDKWVVYISKGTMDHIKSHMSPSVELGDAPGSYYTQDWKVGVENVISKNEPQVSDKPPFRTAWTGLDSGVKVGFVTIGHDDKISKGELDGYKKYTYERPVRDSKVEENILIKVEDAKETNFLTIVGAKVGEVSGKGLISLWTTYPDFKDGKVDGKDIPMNRSEFEKAGFYFRCTKDFFDKVPNEVSESKSNMKYIKKFESFNEGILQKAIDFAKDPSGKKRAAVAEDAAKKDESDKRKAELDRKEKEYRSKLSPDQLKKLEDSEDGEHRHEVMLGNAPQYTDGYFTYYHTQKNKWDK